MLLSIVLALSINSVEDLPVFPDHVEEQSLANAIVDSYQQHPSGNIVYDYYICHAMYQRNSALFTFDDPEKAFPSPHDLWDIESPVEDYMVAGPSRDFWLTVNGFVEARIFYGYDRVGHAECQRLLNRHEMSWPEIFRLQERQR